MTRIISTGATLDSATDEHTLQIVDGRFGFWKKYNMVGFNKDTKITKELKINKQGIEIMRWKIEL